MSGVAVGGFDIGSLHIPSQRDTIVLGWQAPLQGKKLMVPALILMMAGLIATGTAAQPKAAPPKWVVFEMMPEGTIYIDPASIQKQGALADMWVLIDYKQPQDDRTGKKIKSDILHYRYDCSARQFSIVTSSAHAGPMGGGAVIDTDAEPQMAPVPPGTTAEQMWQRACSGAK